MIDDLDLRIIEKLTQNGRQSSERIAKVLSSSSGTIKRRIKQLIENEFMRITAVVDPKKIGLTVSAIIGLNITPNKLQEAVSFLMEQSEIKLVTTTTGRFDIMILVRFRSNDELAHFLQKRLTKLKGIRRYETFICLRQEKMQYMQIREFDREVLRK